uniref:Uncharacterized protein n=1 Tax=Oryza rufipogon TaxID=4529 RepID=A0A0E0MXY4_ORYRU
MATMNSTNPTLVRYSSVRLQAAGEERPNLTGEERPNVPRARRPSAPTPAPTFAVLQQVRMFQVVVALVLFSLEPAQARKIKFQKKQVASRPFYLDNLDFGTDSPEHKNIPRIGMYNDSMIAEFIERDVILKNRNPFPTYGKMKKLPTIDIFFGFQLRNKHDEKYNLGHHTGATEVQSHVVCKSIQ